MRLLSIVSLMCLLCGIFSPPAVAQKNRLYVLAYKYKEGDKYRITSSIYKTFTTKSGTYSQSLTGETGFDLYEEIEGADDEAYDMKVRIELTRQTENGKNLTYKLANVFKGDEVRLSFNRFGKIIPNSVEYHTTDSSGKYDKERLSMVRNIFVPFPDKALKIGDTWKVSDVIDKEQLEVLAGASYGIKNPDVNGIYTLESVEEGIAKITLHLEVSGNGKLIELNNALELDFLLMISGNFYFSITDGKIINGNISTDAAGVTVMGDQTIEFKGSHMSTFSIEKYK